MSAVAKISGAVGRQWGWLTTYNSKRLLGDTVAALVVTVLLVPQALAYAMLADLPPQVGIYASIFPLLAYALFGSSRFLNVGPTAVISLMTAVAIADIPEGQRITGAAALGFMSGVFLIILGLLRGGFIMNFVSRSVVAAYITGAAVLIILSQFKHILGVDVQGRSGWELLSSLIGSASRPNVTALLIGGISMVVIWTSRTYLGLGLVKHGMKARTARIVQRLFPLMIIILFTGISGVFLLSENNGLPVVGDVPRTVPPLSFPAAGLEIYQALCLPAFVIALVTFVDSMSTAQTLASRARERIDANRELFGLGASNFVAGMTGGYPVNGSMSRSVVNYTAGGQTPVVGVITALLMLFTALFLAPLLKYLPLAVLAALIIVACFSLFQFRTLRSIWHYNREGGITAFATFSAVLVLGVQWGVVIGVILSMTFHIRTTLKPHMVIVGRFPGTEHYRDADRYNVETHEEVKTLRIDESLYYANARYLEDKVAHLVHQSPKMTDLILMCTAVNRIDGSALSSLETINQRLADANIKLHISELHSHVKERLHRSHFLDHLSGEIFLSQQEAMRALEPEPDWSQYSDHVDIH
ncbi:MAG: sulfate permease [Hyphomonadaceae bacterium]|nr:sulfate permease [Hyphomonadaceae bacterium]